MAKLRDEILEALAETTGLTKKTIRNNISKIRQENALLTPNAAAQVFGKKKGMSFMPKLNPEDKQSLGLYQQAKNITNTFNNTYNTKHDHRNVSVMGETLNNLIIGDNNSGNSQQVGMLEDALSDLLEKVASSDSLTPEEKNDCAAEIGTIASQSKKTTPDKSTIQKAWSAISVLAKIAGLASSVATVGQMLYGSGLIK
jgi:hypothetical protein